MGIEILDPTHEADPRDFALAARLQGLQGATIGVISNGKMATKPFFDALENELLQSYGAAKVVRRTKSNYSAPAEADLMTEAKQWDALIAGVGD